MYVKYFFIFLSFINFVTSQCPTNNRPIVKSSVLPAITNEISFIFYPPGSNLLSFQYSYDCGCQIIDNPRFDKKLPIYIFQHGYTENCNNPNQNSSCKLVVDAIAKYTEANLILVNYANLINRPTKIDAFDYPRAVLNIKHMGPALCKFYECFFEQCNCNKDTKVIGFSLGAQEIHFTFKSCRVKPEHAIGLDPAGPLFLENESLNKNDGKFVQVIHTNPGLTLSAKGPYGNYFNLASVDFWVNLYNAPIQAVCIRDENLLAFHHGSRNICSHYTAVRYLLKTLENPQAYLASECNSLTPDKEYMGFGASKNKTGEFCINIDKI